MARRRDDDYEDEYDDDVVEEYDDDEYDDDDGYDDDRRAELPDRDARSGGPSLMERIKGLFVTPQARPGEHDVVRSPFVMWLVGGTVTLLLVGLIFYFLIARETAQRQFDAAKVEMDSGKHAQAIALLDTFLNDYPNHKLTEVARITQGQAKILSHIDGGSADWIKGVEEVQNFITTNRDSEPFTEYTEKLREYADKISYGAARNAIKSRKPEELDASKQAQKILERYAPEGGVPKDRIAEILETQEQAETAIREKNDFDGGVANIQASIDKGDLLGALEQRRQLMRRNVKYQSMPKTGELLNTILAAELKTVKPGTDTAQAEGSAGREAMIEEAVPPSDFRPLSITPLSRNSNTEESSNTLVFGVGADSLYGIDAVTGNTAWSKPIGLGQPFHPMRVNAAVAALLCFDTRFNELVLRSQSNGELIWRQPIPGALAGAPLVDEEKNQVYLPTLGRSLFKVNLDTGRISGQLTFNQQLSAPPVMTSKGDHLIIAGDSSLIYTVSLRPFECKAVTYTGHAPGSIKAPILGMASLFAVCENDQADSCQLRIYDGGDDAIELKQIANTRIDGLVTSTPIARGRTLYVPSNPQTLNVYTISDNPEQETITELARRSVQDAADAPIYIYLSAGPAGQTWMFSRSLRRLEIKTESIKLSPDEIGYGVATQPIQQIGEDFFLGRNPNYGKSVFFTKNARQREMSANWRLVIGNRILASTVADNNLIGISDSGAVFKVSDRELDEGGFLDATTFYVKPSIELDSPTGGVATSDGRLMFYVAGKEPALWMIRSNGQLDQKFTLGQNGALQTDPAAIAAGVVCPQQGRLSMVGTQGRVSDFRSPQEAGQKAWTWLTPLDDTTVMAIDETGHIIKVQYRTSPNKHLTEVSSFDLTGPMVVRPGVAGGKIGLADTKGKLVLLDTQGFDALGEIDLPSPATNDIWIAKEKMFVETGRNKLHCFDISSGLKALWSIDAPGGVSGLPYSGKSRTMVTLRDGSVIMVDADGTPANPIPLGQQLQSGPIRLGNKLVVTALDGSLHRVESLFSGNQE